MGHLHKVSITEPGSISLPDLVCAKPLTGEMQELAHGAARGKGQDLTQHSGPAVGQRLSSDPFQPGDKTWLQCKGYFQSLSRDCGREMGGGLVLLSWVKMVWARELCKSRVLLIGAAVWHRSRLFEGIF